MQCGSACNGSGELFLEVYSYGENLFLAAISKFQKIDYSHKYERAKEQYCSEVMHCMKE